MALLALHRALVVHVMARDAQTMGCLFAPTFNLAAIRLVAVGTFRTVISLMRPMPKLELHRSGLHFYYIGTGTL